MNFYAATQYPAGTPIVLVDATPGVWCRAWVLHATISHRCPLPVEPSDVYWNGVTLLTKTISIAGVNAVAGAWWWESGSLYVSTPAGESIWGGTVQAFVKMRFSNHPRVVSGVAYDPRFRSVPSLNQRIEAQFGGVAQIGGGTLALNNADGFFDTKMDWQWDARNVVVSMAIDLPDGPAVAADFQPVATWTPSEWSRTRLEFKLTLREPKSRIKSKLPTATYNRTDFPNIDDDLLGLAIPIAYGRLFGQKADLLDPSLKKFKVASHAIHSFNAVRILRQFEETRTESVSDFIGYSATTFRKYIQGPLTPREVRNDATVLTSKSTAAQVDTTSNSYAYQDGWLYINPGGSSLSVTWDYSVSGESWATSNFETQNLSDGTFTLGTDWTVGADVSVDFTGKPNVSGKPIETPPDIISDILNEAGVAEVNGSSIVEANKEFDVGEASNGAKFCRRCIGIALRTPKRVDEIIGEINAYSGTYTYTDGSNGNLSVGAFWPKTTPSTEDISDSDIIDFSESTDTDGIHSKQVAFYADHVQDDYRQRTDHARLEAQHLHNQPDVIVDERTLPVPLLDDATHYAQRWSLYRSRPIRKYNVTLWWKGWHYNLGAQLYINAPNRGLVGKVEVLGRTVDLNTQQIKLVLGDMRGLGDSVGWWVSDAQALPSEFATLTGYGSGSVTWNKLWDSKIKAWARANVGYWTDANGLAESTDPESFIPSSWF